MHYQSMLANFWLVLQGFDNNLMQYIVEVFLCVYFVKSGLKRAMTKCVNQKQMILKIC